MQKLFALALFCLLSTISFHSSAQTNEASLIYIDCADLTPEKYGAIFKKLNDNSEFKLSEACVPAKVFSIKTNNPQADKVQQFARIKQILQEVGTDKMVLLPHFNDELFMNRCSAARLGR